MDCHEFNAQLPKAILDRGPNGPRAAAVEHAAGCTSCRQTLLLWEDAQRAIESTLGNSKVDPNHLRTMAESLYAERFGTALDLKGTPSPARGGAWSTPVVLAAAAGLTLGYLIWGTASQSDALSQILLQQALSGAPFGRGMFPAIIAGGGVARTMFAICLVIWISRSGLWRVLFPIAAPRGLYFARRAAILLVMAGVYKVVGDTFVGPTGAALGGLGFGPGAGLMTTIPVLVIGWVVASAVWTAGFWVYLFAVLFIVIENLSLAYLKTGELPSRSASRDKPAAAIES